LGNKQEAHLAYIKVHHDTNKLHKFPIICFCEERQIDTQTHVKSSEFVWEALDRKAVWPSD